MTTIGHVVLSVSDWEKSQIFYDQLMKELGFTEAFTLNEDWGNLKEYESQDHHLLIQFEKEQKHKEFQRFPGLNHLGFKVDMDKQVDNLHQLVQSLGVKITRPPRKYPEYDDKYYAFFFRDPDGVPLEIYAD